MICLPLFGWRRRAQAGKTSYQRGESTIGVFGAAWPPQRTVPEGSTSSRGPAMRMHHGSAHFLDVAGRWVMQAVQALPASSGSSLRPVSTSNGAGSRAAGSRGPWSSAELATRPVRKGPPKPKGNAPDSRKTRTARAVSIWDRIVHFHTSAYSVSPHARPKRPPAAPRTVQVPEYTGWCLACLEAAVASTGGRSRTPPGASCGTRRTAIPVSTLQQAIVALAALRLSESFPPHAVQRAWTVRHGRALTSRRQQGKPRSRR